MQFAKSIAISAFVAAVAAQNIGEPHSISNSDSSSVASTGTTKTGTSATPTGSNSAKAPPAKEVEDSESESKSSETSKNGAARIAGSFAAIAIAAAFF
ncbi:hypothetical protein IW152_001713 [Coemansia sp. BCRC 34962]|nr:hypothetical protein IW152_001713 [Coemansia sp. BCRC 34962]